MPQDRDAWGLVPASADSPARDSELGYTTNDDPGWAPVPVLPDPIAVTRTVFAWHFVLATGSTVRNTILKLGVHRRRS